MGEEGLGGVGAPGAWVGGAGRGHLGAALGEMLRIAWRPTKMVGFLARPVGVKKTVSEALPGIY